MPDTEIADGTANVAEHASHVAPESRMLDINDAYERWRLVHPWKAIEYDVVNSSEPD